jgi:hypothetical protein
LPTPHNRHAEIVDEPFIALYYPALQLVQDTAAEELEYVPAGQERHSATDVAPTVDENDPAGQATHDAFEVAPNNEEYVPATQGRHKPDVSNCPEGHRRPMTNE